LYATGWSVFWRVVLPLTKPGVVAGCILVFIPSLGAFITPDLLGGAKTMMVGNLIQHQYLVVRDWPLGSAISFALMALVLLGLWGYFKVERAGRLL
ncbi:MAG: ABC transporter permease, partial [bacterium]